MRKISKFEMFSFSFMLSAFSFGGGYITIPMLRKKFVEEKKLITEEILQDLAAIAQSSPGSISVSLSSGVAYEIGGLGLMLVTFIASILPPLIIITLISQFYDAFMMNMVIQSIFKGLELGVAVIMVILVKDMMTQLYKRDHKVAIVLLFLSLLINVVLRFHVVFILVFNVASVLLIHAWEESK